MAVSFLAALYLVNGATILQTDTATAWNPNESRAGTWSPAKIFMAGNTIFDRAEHLE